MHVHPSHFDIYIFKGASDSIIIQIMICPACLEYSLAKLLQCTAHLKTDLKDKIELGFKVCEIKLIKSERYGNCCEKA